MMGKLGSAKKPASEDLRLPGLQNIGSSPPNNSTPRTPTYPYLFGDQVLPTLITNGLPPNPTVGEFNSCVLHW